MEDNDKKYVQFTCLDSITVHSDKHQSMVIKILDLQELSKHWKITVD